MSSRVTRRQLLRYSMMLAGAATLGELAACAPSAPTVLPAAPAPAAPQPATDKSGAAQPSAPKRGGTLEVLAGHQVLMLDHHKTQTAWERPMVGSMAEGLVAIKPDGTIVPALAESWKQEDDLTWVFNLRKGVKFHDGTDFNASAVDYNFKRLFAKETKAPRAVSYMGWLDSWNKVDDYTVKLHLKAPFSPFMTSLGYQLEAFIGSPTAMEKWGQDDYKAHPTGTGPFQFKEYTPTTGLVLEAFDGYWGGRPYLDRIVNRYVAEESSRTVLMQTEQGLVSYQVEAGSLQTLKADPKIDLVMSSECNALGIEFNLEMKPFTDHRVREALYRAVDRTAIIENIVPGLSRPVKGQIVSGCTWASNPNVQDYAYDPKKARDLLAEAGYPTGFDTVLVHPTGRFGSDAKIAEAVQGFWAAIGVRVKLETGDVQTWATRMFAGKDPTWMHSSYGYDLDPHFAAYPRWHSRNWGQPGNFVHFKDARVDELLDKAGAILDQAERQKMYWEVDQILTDYIPRIPLFDMPTVWAVNKKVKDFQPGPGVFPSGLTLKNMWIER